VRNDFTAVFVRGEKFLVVAALVFSTGAHWAALQTVAWTTMLASNLRSDSLTQAVSKPFDGEHPCPLCKAIAAGKKSEKKSEAIAPVMKLEFPPVAAAVSLFPPAQFELMPPQTFSANSSFSKPPVPPPRTFSV
jgi:hypothetical protein